MHITLHLGDVNLESSVYTYIHTYVHTHTSLANAGPHKHTAEAHAIQQ